MSIESRKNAVHLALASLLISKDFSAWYLPRARTLLPMMSAGVLTDRTKNVYNQPIDLK